MLLNATTKWLTVLSTYFTMLTLNQGVDSGRADEEPPKAINGVAPGGISGHLQPFGSTGPFLAVDNFSDGGFPNATYFFEQHVLARRPLKMPGAGRLSAAFERWATDEYFLSKAAMVGGSRKHKIVVETTKKEKRTNPVRRLHFDEFVRTYNDTEQYMVDNVPEEFRRDVLLPGPLQCQQLYEEMLIEMIMWMSSGGTSSVVHTDSVDNIICVYRGQKTFVMIDPAIYNSEIIIDHPEGAYSGVDVDSVDYVVYPGLENVKYHVVNVSAGDCLYVPYKWIHQVRTSNEPSIAVNVWWNPHHNSEVDLHRCPDDLDITLTLDKVTFHGFESMNEDIVALREHLADIILNGIDIERFVDRLIGSEEDLEVVSKTTGYRLPFTQIFLVIDKNRDKMVTIDELDQLTERDWTTMQRQMMRYDAMVVAAVRQQTKENDSDDDDDGKHFYKMPRVKTNDEL